MKAPPGWRTSLAMAVICLTLAELTAMTDGPANGNQHIYWVDAAVIEDVRAELNDSVDPSR